MKERGHGSVVMLASQAGQIGVYGYTAYTPTKFALRGLAESLRMELKPYRVAVSLVVPPDTDTPLLARETFGILTFLFLCLLQRALPSVQERREVGLST